MHEALRYLPYDRASRTLSKPCDNEGQSDNGMNRYSISYKSYLTDNN